MAPRSHKARGGHEDDSDAISELSHSEMDDASVRSGMSKSGAFVRKKFGGLTKPRKFGRQKSGDSASVGSGSKVSKKSRTGVPGASRTTASSGSRTTRTNGAPPSPGVVRARGGDARSVGSGGTSRSKGSQTDKQRLTKDAKSRFNIGLVYLKTGDYAKAQENLEHSLYCHIQLSGHNAKNYSNDTLVAIASVREKLGDCYVANTAIVDKCLALDHYEESRRLLKSMAPEDAPDIVKEMLERVEEQLKNPELCSGEQRRRPEFPPSISKYQMVGKYEMKGNAKAKATLGVGVAAGAGVAAAAATPPDTKSKWPKRSTHLSNLGLEKVDILGVGKGLGKLADFATDVVDKIEDVFDDSSSEGSRSLHRRSNNSHHHEEGFQTALSHMDRDNHRTALNYLASMQEGGSMKDEHFRASMAGAMLKVADSALEAEKVSVATDAYEEAFAVLKQDENSGAKLKHAMKGCIKGHKLLAMEMESMRDYSSSIQHRSRAYQLLEEDNRVIPACHQLMKIAYLHGEREDFAKSTVTLSDAIRRLFKGVKSLDVMPADRFALLIQCYNMRAICHAKSKKWNEALEQYDDLLPLIETKQGKGSRDYYTALIHKAALLVTMGNHRLSAATLQKYMQLRASDGMVVDNNTHLLALDTFAATQLKSGNVDKAVTVFQKKLDFLKTNLPQDDDQISDTKHKLGCLLAYSKDHEAALPLLNESLQSRKVLYDGKHKSVFETSWAVAATNQSLGDSGKALREYVALIDKMTKMNEVPIDAVTIHNSAGKLFYEDGKMDKAVQSFNQALRLAETAGKPELTAEIMLNLANALSARGDADKAMKYYDKLLKNRSLKKTKLFFLTLYNKSLLQIKLGEIDEATDVLVKIAETRSSMANNVRGEIYLTLGSLAVKEGHYDEAVEHYEKSLEVVEEDDIIGIAQAKKSIGMAQLAAGHEDDAIAILEDVLEDLSQPNVPNGKTTILMQAETWNCLARVYKKQGDISEAKNYAKLGTYHSFALSPCQSSLVS